MKILIVALICMFGFVQNQTLTLNITNIQQNTGTIRVGIYDPNHGFGTDNDKPTYWKYMVITKAENQVVVFELPRGRYTVAIYHDLNDNNKIDKTFFGIPKEPYGFSNNFRPKFSAPKFEDCAFELSDSPKTLTIKLR